MLKLCFSKSCTISCCHENDFFLVISYMNYAGIKLPNEFSKFLSSLRVYLLFHPSWVYSENSPGFWIKHCRKMQTVNQSIKSSRWPGVPILIFNQLMLILWIGLSFVWMTVSKYVYMSRLALFICISGIILWYKTLHEY